MVVIMYWGKNYKIMKTIRIIINIQIQKTIIDINDNRKNTGNSN